MNRIRNEFLLCFFLGFLGAHRFYRKQTGLGFLYLFTFGLFGIGWLVDTIKLLIALIRVTSSEKPIEFNSSQQSDTHDYLEFKLAGVTFKNADGTDRQSLLEKYSNDEPPFDQNTEAIIRRYEYEGKPAFALDVNRYMFGAVPSETSPIILSNWHRFDGVSSISVYGGYDGKSYGCRVAVRFKK